MLKTTFAILALAVACLATSGCSTMSAANQNALTAAMAEKIEHCSMTGSLAIGAGGLAATGTGFANTAQLNCPGKPYDPPAAAPAPAQVAAVIAPITTPAQ